MSQPFTTTLDPKTLHWLRETSKREHKSIRQLIEEAITHYKTLEKKQHLKESFLRAQKDKEVVSLCEEGLEDSSTQFHKHSL